MTSIKTRILSAGLALATMMPSVVHAQDNQMKITRIYGENSALTAIAVSDYAIEDNKKAYVVSNETFADGLVAGVLAGERNAAIYYTNADSMDLQTKEALKETDQVVAVGGKKAVPSDQYKSYADRISGANRYETAVNTAKALGTDRDILVVNGLDYPDAISAIPLAIENNMNILYVDQDELPAATKAYLEEYGTDKKIIFVGGSGVLSQSVKEAVLEASGRDPRYTEMRTIAGANRYETSQLILEYFGEVSNVIVTTGSNYKDALAASTLSAHKGAPILLMDSVDQIDIDGLQPVDNVYVVGGGVACETVKEVVSQVTGTEASQVEINEKYLAIDQELIAKAEAEKKAAEEKAAAEKAKKEAEAKKAEEAAKASKGGKDFSYSKVLDCKATAYDDSYASNGKWGAVTAMGTDLRPGVVAVDPKVIPLGTKLYIESTDDWPDYGYAVAEDVGGAIKGNKVDLFFKSSKTVYNFGRRNVKVYILD